VIIHDDELLYVLLDKLSELGLADFGELILPLLERIAEKGTKGKCPNGEEIGIDHYINFIPSRIKGMCCVRLVVVCFDGDSLDERLREMVYHSGIYCQNRNKRVLFLTSKWDTGIFEKHADACRIIESWGVDVNFVLIGKNTVNMIK